MNELVSDMRDFMAEEYYECQDCRHMQIDDDTKEPYCRRSYKYVNAEQSACDDFEKED